LIFELSKGQPESVCYIRWYFTLVDALRLLRSQQLENLRRTRDVIADRIFVARCHGAEDVDELEENLRRIEKAIEMRDPQSTMEEKEIDSDLSIRSFAEKTGMEIRQVKT